MSFGAGCRRLGAVLLACALPLCAGGAEADALRDGDRAFQAGRLEEALRSYEQAASRGSALGQAGIGRVWLRRGRYPQASEAFRRAVEMDPNQALGYYGQGEVYRRQGRCDQAIPLFEKATGLDRRFPEAQLGLGNCLVDAGQFERGIDVLGKGLKWGRMWSARFLAARGTAWMTRDSLRNAGIDFTRARELAPNDPSIRKAIGGFYIRRGTWALAIPELRASVALDSTDVEARLWLAQALFYDRQYDQALEVYRGLTAQEPDFPPGQLGLGDLLFRAGAADPRRYADAREPLERYVRLEPEDPRGWSLLGRALFHLGEQDTALVVMLRARQLGDSTRELNTTLGRAFAGRKEWDRAIESFEKGEPGPEEYPLLAQIYDIAGHPQEADSVYHLMLARDSTSKAAAFAFHQLGRLRFRNQDYEDAERFFGRAVALDPANGEAWFYRGLTLRELNQNPEALRALREAAARDTEQADRFFWLGVLLDDQKLLDEAERVFRRSVELDSASQLAGKSYRQLGYYRLLKKMWTAAIPLLERAVELDPQDAQGWLWLGQAHQNAGNRRRAEECYRRVLTLEPESADARNGLKSLKAALRRRPTGAREARWARRLRRLRGGRAPRDEVGEAAIVRDCDRSARSSGRTRAGKEVSAELGG